MAGRIYVLNDGADLLAMEETLNDSECFLPELLANYPELLVSGQTISRDSGGWLDGPDGIT